MTEYLDLTDYLLIAEAVTGIDAVVLAKAARLELAESALGAPQAAFDEVEFYPEFVTKAAVLCARLAWNHPLPDGEQTRRLGFSTRVLRPQRVPAHPDLRR